MANRVLLGQDGSNYVLKVSRAGVNVLNASSQELIFDSTAQEAAFPLAQGSVSVTTNTNGAATSSWISYGRTLSFFPVIFATRLVGSVIIPVPEIHGQTIVVGTGTKSFPTFEIRSETITRTYLEIEKSQFRIKIQKEPNNQILYGSNAIKPSTTYTFFYNVLSVGGATPL